MRKFIRSILQRFGYDIVKHKPAFVRGKLDKASLIGEYRWLLEYGFGTIVDVGANEGQFADRIRQLFPNAMIYAFEPLPGVFQRLTDNFKTDGRFRAFNVGLGERREEMELFENEYSPSSSFLKTTASLGSNFKDAVKTTKVRVHTDRLDEVLSGYEIDAPLLIKIDVQGFEDKVMAGGGKILQQAKLVICELSFAELYEGQPLFGEIYDRFIKLGFVFAGMIEQLRSPETNRILQADGIFIKT